MTFYVAIDRATVATGCLQVLPTTNRERVVFNRLEEDGSVDACGHLRPEQVDTVLSSAPAPVALECYRLPVFHFCMSRASPPTLVQLQVALQ